MQPSDMTILAALTLGALLLLFGFLKFMRNRNLRWGLVTALGAVLVAVAAIDRVELSISSRDFSQEMRHLGATAERQMNSVGSAAERYLP